MDNIKIQTTQNVEIEYQLASVGDRILASLLDYVFIIAYWFVFFIIATFTEGFFGSLTLAILLLLPVFLYDLYCEILFQGRSFGKMILKIKVVKADGTQASIGAYFIRWVFRLIDTFLFSAGVALLTVIINGKGQRLGDMAAGTTVVKTKQRVSLHDTILMQQQKPEYVPVFPQVSRLTDSDVAIIKDVLMLGWKTRNYAALQKLTDKTKQVMGIDSGLPDPAYQDNIKFLNTVLQDYTSLKEN